MAERRDDDPQDEGLLARWSRRKQAARKGDDQPAVASEDQAPAPAPQADLPAEQEHPELPDPATLDASSDFKPFLKPGVPIETQRAALRRLWRLNPIYNHMDGLDDYCEDYTDQAKVVKGMRTAYRVGRGFLDQIDKAANAVSQTADPAPVERLEDPTAAPVEPGTPPAQQASLEPAPKPAPESVPESAKPAAPRRRRLPRRV